MTAVREELSAGGRVSSGGVCVSPFSLLPLCHVLIFPLGEGDVSGGDKSKKGVKRKKTVEESGETAKRRSARVRNTKCKKEEKVDFQGLLVKFLPSRYCALFLKEAADCCPSVSAAFQPIIAPPFGYRLQSVDFTSWLLGFFSSLLNTGAVTGWGLGTS